MTIQLLFMILFPTLIALGFAVEHLIDLWRGEDE